MKKSGNRRYYELVYGAPGVGKSDMIERYCKRMGFRIVKHRNRIFKRDPIDYKGLPYIDYALNTEADGAEATVDQNNMWLHDLLTRRPSLALFEDLQSASPHIQALVMHELLHKHYQKKFKEIMDRKGVKTNGKKNKARSR